MARTPEGYVAECSGEDYAYQTIEIPAGIAAMIENIGETDAYVINTPSPAWHQDDRDEHPVNEWDKSTS